MLIGAHAILYSTNANADRAFLRDVLRLPHVDAGGGWLIFGLPPAEVAVHPSETGGKHELYLMCADVEGFVRAMKEVGVECSAVRDQGWGLLTDLKLPGGGRMGVYQPKHTRPAAAPAARAPKRASGMAAERRPNKPVRTSGKGSPAKKPVRTSRKRSPAKKPGRL